MIINTKYHEIRKSINQKLEEFFQLIDDLDAHNKENSTYELAINDKNTIIDLSDENKIELTYKPNKNEEKIFISTSQILTKILLGKLFINNLIYISYMSIRISLIISRK